MSPWVGLQREHDIPAGNTPKVSDATGDGTHAEAAPVPAAVEPTDTRLDHLVFPQAQTPMDDIGTTSIADTPIRDEPAGDKYPGRHVRF